MNCPSVQLPQNAQHECNQFYQEARLNVLQMDSDQLQASVKSDDDFLTTMRRFATNIIHLNHILVNFRQDGGYSPMIKVKYGRELGSFLMGTKNLLARLSVKERLTKLRECDLVRQLTDIGMF
jgi:hypothetical protein